MSVLRRARHGLRRISQTRSAFDNPAAVLTTMAWSAVRGGERDVRFAVNGAAVLAPARRGAVFPVYEVFAEDVYRLSLLTDGLPSRPRVLDIGAHVGSFSVATANAVPDAEIWAYEASPTTATYLAATVAASGLDSRVHVRPEALAAEIGTVTLSDAGICSPLSSTTKRSGNATVTVPSITVAEAFERCGGSADLVKIDAEGVEYDILLLSDADLWAGVSRLVLEYHEVDGRSPEQIIQRLAGIGLQLVAREAMIGNPREGTMWFRRDAGAATAGR
jgi:FkbM family methyltransferase